MNKNKLAHLIGVSVLILSVLIPATSGFSVEINEVLEDHSKDSVLENELELEAADEIDKLAEPVVEEQSEIETEAPKEQEDSIYFDEEIEEEAIQASVDSIAQVTTFEQLRLAVADPTISEVEVMNNLTRSGTGVATAIGTLTRDLVINGNGFSINFGADNGSLYLGALPAGETATLRFINASVAKTGQTAIFAVDNALNPWTVELENIVELATSGARIALVPNGKVAFTGGINRFERSAIHTIFDVKDIDVYGGAEVIVNRGNAVIFTSGTSIPNPSLVIREGSKVDIITASGISDTVALRGENPKVQIIEGSSLSIQTAGTTAQATDTSNNALALPGNNSILEVTGNSTLSVNSVVGNANAKRGIHLAGESPQIRIEESTLDVRSATGTGINLVGNAAQLYFSNANVTVNATTGRGISLEGTIPEMKISNESTVNLANTATVNAGITIANGGNLEVSNHGTLSIQGTSASGISFLGATSSFNVLNQGNVTVRNTSSTALLSPVSFSGSESTLAIDNAQMTIEKLSGTTPALRMTALANLIKVSNSGGLSIINPGNGTANNGNTNLGNQGIQISNGTSTNPAANEIVVENPDSEMIVHAASGPAIDATSNALNMVVKNQGNFVANGRSSTAVGATIASNSATINVEFNNPENVDIRNNRVGGGNIINASTTSKFVSANSDFSLWLNGSNFGAIQDRHWEPLRYSLTGANYSTIASTNNPRLFNTQTNSFGTSGLAAYSRLSSQGEPIQNPENPLDPLDPEVEVDPENHPELPEEQGLISIDFVSQFNFGTKNIATQARTYYADPQRLLNGDGTVNQTEERPNYIQITDRRSIADQGGWELSLRQEEQFKTADGKELLGAQLQFENAELLSTEQNSKPEFVREAQILLPGVRHQLIIAENAEGQGTWIYRFGNETTGGESVKLEVPKGSNPDAKSYSTTLNWELNAVPGN